MHKNLERDGKNSMLRKYSKDGNEIDQIIDKIQMPINLKATLSE